MHAQEEMLYRYTTRGEGVFTAGKRLLPGDLVAEANENRKWLPKPTLPHGAYLFYLTGLGARQYEQTLKRTHDKYLPDTRKEETPKSALGNIVYQDKWQVVERKGA